MFKRSLAIILALTFVLGALGAAMALDGKGNSRKGKYLFRKNCRSCHAEGKAAKDLSPIDMTQAGWKAAFEDMDKKIPCRKDWPAKIKEKDINDIYSYMYGHAKDSPSPAKCK